MPPINRTPKVVRAARRTPESRDTRTSHYGWFFHPRTKEMIPYQRVLACQFLIVTAADPEVLKFSTKPQPLQWWNGSGWEEYHPCYAVHRAGHPKGVVDIVDVEILYGFEYARDRIKFERLQRDAASKSRVFKVYTEKEIMAEPRYSNAMRISCHADTQTIPIDDIDAVAAFASDRARFTLDELIAATGLDFDRAYPAVLNRVAVGLLEIDLDIPFDSKAPIRRRSRR